MRALGWLAVAVLYYFASWPPLIFFSWLAAALRVAAEPLAGLLLAAVLLPFYYQHKELYLVDYSWTIAPAEAVALCLLPVLGYQLWLTRRRRGWPLPATDRLALLWLAINLAAVFTVWQWPAYGQGLRDVVIVPLVLYLAVRLLVTSQAQQEQIALALLLGGLLAAVGGLVTWWRGEGVVADGLLRLVGFSYSPNHTALYLERTLLLGAGLTLAWPRPVWRWGLAGATAIVGVALLLTVSRGAWFLGLPVALGMAGWLVQRRVGGRGTMRLVKQRPVRFWLGLLLVLSLLAVVVLLLLPAISARLHNSETVSSRLRIWQATFALWRDYPLFGVGVGGFFWRYPAFLIGSISEPNILHPHNVWLEFAAIWGLSGLLWLGALLVIVVRQSRCWAWAPVGRDFWLALGLAAGLAAGFAHAQVDTLFVLADLAAWNWLALALLDSIRKFLCATKPAREGK